MTAHTDEQFTQAEKEWDLERLYNDLTTVKGKKLTRIEKLHLRGLLCGYSPTEIAEMLHRNVRGLEVNLCNKLYKYVKTIVNREQERVENWRSICQWLEEAGYKAQTNQSKSNHSIPVDTKVHIEKITVENNKIEIFMNTQITINTQLLINNGELLITPLSSLPSQAEDCES
ncbi:hypothetical protein [Candidatus Parabeggiatoa sp. HSG14]|uniref:hypothetical protein n=1 Tax=Candidatus Parabeggiatoa sp. HSG14 TaxID=3055593 RepID=UPI0025A7FFF2|nr:hypothetical protein [Thiotrichales bacterium HSG14]